MGPGGKTLRPDIVPPSGVHSKVTLQTFFKERQHCLHSAIFSLFRLGYFDKKQQQQQRIKILFYS